MWVQGRKPFELWVGIGMLISLVKDDRIRMSCRHGTGGDGSTHATMLLNYPALKFSTFQNNTHTDSNLCSF